MCVRDGKAGVSSRLGKSSTGTSRSNLHQKPQLDDFLQAETVTWPLNSFEARQMLRRDQIQRKH